MLYGRDDEQNLTYSHILSIHGKVSLSGARRHWGRAGANSGSAPASGSPFLRVSRGKKVLATLILLVMGITLFARGGIAQDRPPQIRVKDLVKVDGADDNELQGIGLVVGLPGTGDQSSPARAEMLRNKLNRFLPDKEIQPTDIATGNSALVALNATLPAFQSPNSRIDVSVSAIGDAENLAGGQLWGGYLLGPDQKIYAFAQGSVSVSGNVLTQGYIPEGGRVLRQAPQTDWIKKNTFVVGRGEKGELKRVSKHFVQLNLRDPNWNTAQQIADSLNNTLRKSSWGRDLVNEKGVTSLAVAKDRSTVLVQIPSTPPAVGGESRTSEAPPRRSASSRGGTPSYANLVSDILRRPVLPLSQATFISKTPKVVINEKSGMWAIQGNVVVSPVTVSRGVQGLQSIQIDRPMLLRNYIQQNQVGANLTDNQVIEILKALDAAGAISAEVEAR